MWCLFPWLGSYAFLAMERFLKLKCAKELGISALDPSRPYFIQFKMKAGEKEFFDVLANEAAKEFDPMELVYKGEVPLFEKYDEFLPDELVRKGFAYGVLDIDGMKSRIRSWAKIRIEKNCIIYDKNFFILSMLLWRGAYILQGVSL